MAWLSQILTVIYVILKSLPSIIELIKLISEKIQDVQDSIEKKKKLEEIKKAIETARKDKDTSGLEDIFGNQAVKPKPAPSVVTFNLVMPEKKSLPIADLPPSGSDPSSLDEIKETEPVEEPKKNDGFFFKIRSAFGGNMGSGIQDSNYKQRTELSGTARMGSKFFVFLLMFLIGCKSDQINRPNYKPKLFAGSADNQAIIRAQSNEVIRCEDPRFNDYVAMRYSTLSCLYQTYILNAVKFKDPNPVCKGIDIYEIKQILEEQKLLKQIN